jgi:hypothetical protein
MENQALPYLPLFRQVALILYSMLLRLNLLRGNQKGLILKEILSNTFTFLVDVLSTSKVALLYSQLSIFANQPMYI